MKILVQDKTIETTEIVDIVELPGSREAGFKIIMIDAAPVIFKEDVPYETTIGTHREINDRWRRLRNAVTEQWKKDKSDIPTFKL